MAEKTVLGLAIKVSGKKEYIQNLLGLLTTKYIVVRSSEFKETPEDPNIFLLYVTLLPKDVIGKVK